MYFGVSRMKLMAYRHPLIAVPQKNYRDFDKFLKINKDLVDETKLRGYHERDGRQLEDLEILAELQHYGAATCLIDFSYSASDCTLGSPVNQDSNTSQDCDSETSQDSETPLNDKVFAVHHRSSDDFEEIDSNDLKKEIDDFLQDEEHSPVVSLATSATEQPYHRAAIYLLIWALRI